MFSEQVIIFGVILLAFIVLLIFIKYWPFKIISQNTSVLKYQKLDLPKGDITFLSTKEFELEITHLTEKGYELSPLRELYDFRENKIQLADKVFIILMDYDIPDRIKTLALELVTCNKSIIIFTPILQKYNTNQVVIADKEVLENEIPSIDNSLK